MTWQRPTSWSAETADGLWYAERNGREWWLWLNRGRAKGFKGKFRSLKAAKEAAQCLAGS